MYQISAALLDMEQIHNKSLTVQKTADNCFFPRRLFDGIWWNAPKLQGISILSNVVILQKIYQFAKRGNKARFNTARIIPGTRKVKGKGFDGLLLISNIANPAWLWDFLKKKNRLKPVSTLEGFKTLWGPVDGFIGVKDMVLFIFGQVTSVIEG